MPSWMQSTGQCRYSTLIYPPLSVADARTRTNFLCPWLLCRTSP